MSPMQDHRGLFIALLLLALVRLELAVNYWGSSGSTAGNQLNRWTKSSRKNLTPVYEAKNLEFWFPSELERRRAIQSGNYDPSIPLPIDVDVYYPPYGGSPTVFMTIPRFGSGVPYSLACLTDVQKANGSEIRPYPSYEWHNSHGNDCDGLTSVYRVQIDSCGQMWILDSGEISFIQHCPPQVVVIDLSTSQLIHRYRLPAEMFKTNSSRFVTPLVDIADPSPLGICKKAFVYLADPTGVGMVVYDVVNGQSWRIENKFTYPSPDFGTHKLAGESFELMDGIFSLTVTPASMNTRRHLYFHALSNDLQIAIPLDVVNNGSLWNREPLFPNLQEFRVLGRRGVQCAIASMSAEGYLFCGHLEPIGIFAWNIRLPYTPQNRQLVAENPTTLQFISGLKVIRNPAGKEELWVLSNRLQKAFTQTMDYREINYRIQKCGVEELLTGRSC